MKKIFGFIALTLCALFVLSACGAKPVVLPDDGLERQKIIDFVADVGLCGSIGNGSGNIIGFLFAHIGPP